MKNKKAIVLLSGGMDSAVTLYMARKTHEVHALSFEYGQKASRELVCAARIAMSAGVKHEVVSISLPWKGSALLDKNMDIPEHRLSVGKEIPVTYVPARNIIFLSFAVSFAEAINAEAVFIGAHQLDYSNYPDCRSDFFKSFGAAVKKGTKTGVQGRKIEIKTPIINMTKSEIVKEGLKLNVPFEYTWSCYEKKKNPCGVCESCILRAKGFRSAGVCDPAIKKIKKV